MSEQTSAASPSMPAGAAVRHAVRSTPVVEASVWDGAELAADPGWRHRLTDEERAELLQATRQAAARGLEVGRFGREEFPLPLLGPRIESLVESVENGRGVALLHGFPVDTLDDGLLRIAYWGFGVHAGEVISQNSKGQLLAEVSNRGNEYADPNTRGFSTNAELYPHVDTSDMTTLLCVRDALTGGDSRVVSSTRVFNVILAEHPEYLEPLLRGFRNDLRGEGPTGDINELTHAEVPVYSDHAGRVSCSFNLRMIENAAQKQGKPLAGIDREALDFLRDVTLRPELGHAFRMAPGDIQMVSNHSVFHSRTSFEDRADPALRRCLFRFWINVRGGRPLAPEFADRYNTGPRGGVAVGDGARYVF